MPCGKVRERSKHSPYIGVDVAIRLSHVCGHRINHDQSAIWMGHDGSFDD
jgi:hypothetical protein